MKASKYTKLGLLIVVSFGILIWGLSYLKGNDIFSKDAYYHAVYDRIDGLNVSNKVMLSGYQVGQVSEIKFMPGTLSKLLVTFLIDGDIEIPENSIAQIVTSDLMGTRSIKLVFSDSKTFVEPNDTLPGAVESDLKEQVSMQVLPIKNKAEQLLGTIDSAITVLTVIFNEDARENLSESFANINRTIENIERTTADLQMIVSSEKGSFTRIVRNLDDITTTFSNNTDELENTIQNLSTFSDTLSQFSISPVLANIQEASFQLRDIIEKLNSSETSAGLLLGDDELYYSINALSTDLSALIRDIQTNPQRYLHFSAVDLGKDVYVNAPEGATARNIEFKVHLVSSENQIPLDSKMFEGLGDIEEYEASGAYTYLAGNTNSYSEIKTTFEEARKKFPDASIVAFRNGRLIKLEKALKMLR